MSLESGYYAIETVTPISPDEPVITRPIGAGLNSRVVVLPPGTPPQKWHLEKLPDGNYFLTLDGRSARPDGEAIVLSQDIPPIPWHIIRGPPSPPPIGRDNFGILISGFPQPQRSWEIPLNGDDGANEVPIFLGGVASSIHIFPLER